MDTTLDGLLNCRVMLEQPAKGFRVAVDSVLLASAVPAHSGVRVLDFGCGVGGAMLCLAARVPGLHAMGIDIQEDLADLCRKNIARNNMIESLESARGDATDLPEALHGSFDCALMNPPYHDETRHDASADPGRRTANTEKEGDLPLWIAGAAQALKNGGSLTVIHRADRLDDILVSLKGIFGNIEILPILPKAGEAAKRVIVRAVKDAPEKVTHCSELVLHKPDGGYTVEADAILRHAEALEFLPMS